MIDTASYASQQAGWPPRGRHILASYDEQLAAPPADPHYAERRNSPQNRAPGVVDPAQGKRDAYAAELEKERAILKDLEKRAKAAGVRVDKGAPSKK